MSQKKESRVMSELNQEFPNQGELRTPPPSVNATVESGLPQRVTEVEKTVIRLVAFQESNATRTDLVSAMAKIKDELKDKINNVTLELKNDINNVTLKLKDDINDVKTELGNVKNKLNTHSKISTFVATFVVLIGTGLFALYQDVSDTKEKISDMDRKISELTILIKTSLDTRSQVPSPPPGSGAALSNDLGPTVPAPVVPEPSSEPPVLPSPNM
jgi:hypothetical protein